MALEKLKQVKILNRVEDSQQSNTKEWHIDHVVPFNAFKGELGEKNQRIVCWYKNFKPVSALANLAKGGSWTEEDKQDLIRRYNEEHLT